MNLVMFASIVFRTSAMHFLSSDEGEQLVGAFAQAHLRRPCLLDKIKIVYNQNRTTAIDVSAYLSEGYGLLWIMNVSRTWKTYCWDTNLHTAPKMVMADTSWVRSYICFRSSWKNWRIILVNLMCLKHLLRDADCCCWTPRYAWTLHTSTDQCVLKKWR